MSQRFRNFKACLTVIDKFTLANNSCCCRSNSSSGIPRFSSLLLPFRFLAATAFASFNTATASSLYALKPRLSRADNKTNAEVLIWLEFDCQFKNHS